MMRAKVLMIQGTMSSVGKSLVVAALCRIFKQDGLRAAPFKAQNMALNSFATLDGREVGRAQAMQASAAGVDVTVEMNPILIKPEADAFAQIVVMGKPWARLPAGEYMSRRGELWSVVTRALDALREEYELIVIEGAGSPAELNLRRGDLVNMSIAEYAGAPVLLVGDIDRGGIFAQLIGTRMLLEENESARIKGFIVNKFRGDARLFDEGVRLLEGRGGVPVLGVVPFIHNLRIADEDSVALETIVNSRSAVASIDIVVIKLPHISNFDDFDPLRAEPGVSVRFVERDEEIGTPDMIILPGAKTTIADLNWMRSRGLVDPISERARRGTPILGICGGYQMLGRAICDPLHAESTQSEVEGLGLLPVVTTFEAEKRTERVTVRVEAAHGLFANMGGIDIKGYEIHMGRTESGDHIGSPLRVIARSGELTANDSDGAASAEGWIVGTYFHGLFDNDGLRHAILRNLAARKGVSLQQGAVFDRGVMYDRLAQVVRENVDLNAIRQLIA